MTRWYRAPELLADCQNYGKTVDVWALGCIFAEMLSRKPFFQGRDPTHQLYTIVNVLGSPSEEDISFISHESAKKVIREMGNRPKVPCSTYGLSLLIGLLLLLLAAAAKALPRLHSTGTRLIGEDVGVQPRETHHR